MHKIYRPGEAPTNYNFEEDCPHCGSSIPVIIDDADFEHYEVTCPVCGKTLLLCVLCGWDWSDEHDGEPAPCDWCETHGCFRQRK